MPAAKNIIFDLGGVLLNLNYQLTITAFQQMGIVHFEEMFTQAHADPLFASLETGKITNEEFYAALKKHIPVSVSDAQIDAAWNAMLLDFRTETLQTLKRLSQDHRVYLLSNTNAIHLKKFQEIFTHDTGKPMLEEYFTRCWYSHIIGLRKPDRAIYEFALADAGISASDTLFIDDSIGNIEAAKAIGIQTKLLLPGMYIEELDW